MRLRTALEVSATALVAVFAFAGTALADTAVVAAAAEAPVARIGLALASVIFTAALARGRA